MEGRSEGGQQGESEECMDDRLFAQGQKLNLFLCQLPEDNPNVK